LKKVFNSPDLNAPRYRPTEVNLCNAKHYKMFLEQNPKHANITLDEFKKIISTFNGNIWKNVIESRDGIELPEQVGFIFIGTCPRRTKINVNFTKSIELGQIVQYQNWESDNYTAKIFYTNFETKYRFKNNDLWGFEAVRNFKRTVAKTYPEKWKQYMLVDDLIRVSKLFRRSIGKELRQKETLDILKDYDEFNLT
jgi:hypothetical protein